MPTRQGNNPKRRIAPHAEIDGTYLERLKARTSYTGSPHHKRVPVDYGFHPPASPRPNKSLCDANRCVQLDEDEKGLMRIVMRFDMAHTSRVTRWQSG